MVIVQELFKIVRNKTQLVCPKEFLLTESPLLTLKSVKHRLTNGFNVPMIICST